MSKIRDRLANDWNTDGSYHQSTKLIRFVETLILFPFVFISILAVSIPDASSQIQNELNEQLNSSYNLPSPCDPRNEVPTVERTETRMTLGGNDGTVMSSQSSITMTIRKPLCDSIGLIEKSPSPIDSPRRLPVSCISRSRDGMCSGIISDQSPENDRD